MNIRFAFLNLLTALLLAPLAALHAAESLTISAKPTPVAELEAPPGSGWRGVYFNPQVEGTTDFPWLLHYDAHRELVRRSLFELRKDAGINLVAVQVLIAH